MTWGRHSAALLSIAMIAAGLSACSGTEAGTDAASSTQAPATPLPGVADTSMTVGVVAQDVEAVAPDQRLRFLTFSDRFPGLSPAQITAFLPPTLTLGGRTVSVNATPLAPRNVFEAPDEPVQPICTAQKSSAIVITDVTNRTLIDCLIKNGSVVIDASTTMWDTTALNERAPLLWASATAAADTAEKVLLAQAQQRGVLPQGKATVIKGADDVSRRIADQITIPTLSAAGLDVSPLDVAAASTDATQLSAALDEALAAAPSLVRPVAPRAYPLLASRVPPLTPPRYLVTSNDSLDASELGTFAFDAAALSATVGLGWRPLSDGVPAAPSSAEAGQSCATTYPGIDFNEAASGQQSYLYRWCDAVNLLRIGAAPTGSLTDAAFRDAVWSSGQRWTPAAVFANGWTPNSFAGANQALWLTGDNACLPTSGPCFTYVEERIPLA